MPIMTTNEEIEHLSKQLPPEEVREIKRCIEAKAELMNHPRNRFARFLHRLAGKIEKR